MQYVQKPGVERRNVLLHHTHTAEVLLHLWEKRRNTVQCVFPSYSVAESEVKFSTYRAEESVLNLVYRSRGTETRSITPSRSLGGHFKMGMCVSFDGHIQ